MKFKDLKQWLSYTQMSHIEEDYGIKDDTEDIGNDFIIYEQNNKTAIWVKREVSDLKKVFKEFYHNKSIEILLTVIDGEKIEPQIEVKITL